MPPLSVANAYGLEHILNPNIINKIIELIEKLFNLGFVFILRYLLLLIKRKTL
jgi:hypothetical protein